MIKILYHGGCPDGFGSAYAAWKKFGTGEHIEYIRCSYGSDIVPDIRKGDKVYIFDFSFDRETLLEWNDIAETLVLQDHHVSAQRELDDLPFTHFDMNHSGAYLAWRYFHPKEPVPILLEYVEDRDLWKHELDYADEVGLAIYSYEQNFEIWDNLNNSLEEAFWDVVDEGIAISRFRDRLVDMICSSAQFISLGGFSPIMVNTPVLQSEVGHRLLQDFPDAPFSGCYSTQKDGSTLFSLRSMEGREDVSKIATDLGGGGHRNAAGFIEGKGRRG